MLPRLQTTLGRATQKKIIKSTNLILSDLQTFKTNDLNIMYKHFVDENFPEYHELNKHNLYTLALKIYHRTSNKKSNLPPGTVFDAVNNNKFDEFMEFLNDPNFDPNIRYPNDIDNLTLLIYCVMTTKENGEKYVKELLKKKPDLNLTDAYKQTALMLAARYSRTYSTENTLAMLIKAGSKIDLHNKYAKTALMEAVFVRKVRVVKIQ